MKLLLEIAPVLLAASVACAQNCPEADQYETDPASPLAYPMTSDRYAVQYQLGGSGTWTDAKVYISYFGGTLASPFLSYAGYTKDTSMSFVSIPAVANTSVALRVTKVFGTPFPAIDKVSVRPRVKGIQVSSVSAGTVQLSTNTAADFAGEQFILWWEGDKTQSSAIQGLAFFLDPPYTKPTGSNVKVVTTPADLAGDLSAFDTLDIEGTVAVGSTGVVAFVVPVNIDNIFFGPGAWLQGKLRFKQSGAGHTRKIYGPGVLDGSRFTHANRFCGPNSAHPDDGLYSISWIRLPAQINGVPTVPDGFVVDGLIVSDNDYYATDWFTRSNLNNMKVIGWNDNCDGLQLGYTVRVSNVFVRTGDDSIKMWGSYITVTNATVWQNWNGGVVNLGWLNNSPGDDSLIDGLYVVKTDWVGPGSVGWTSNILDYQNTGVIVSVMNPGTKFDSVLPSVYRNIYVEDPPRVLFSLKIVPHLTLGSPNLDYSLPSVLNLNLENVFTPASTLGNSIGFQIVNGAALTGTMNIGLTNVIITPPNGTATALTSANAATLGKVITNGDNVNVTYSSLPSASKPPAVANGGVLNGASFTVGAPVAPGSIASVFGSGFGASPTGVTVLIGGIVAPLFVVTPGQINFQVPWQLAGQTQTPLTVTSGDSTSAPIIVPLDTPAPGIFLLNSSGQAAVLVANTSGITAPAGTFPGSRPVRQGEYISIYCTGLGSVTNAPATGVPASAESVSLTNSGAVTVSIGGISAPASFSGLAPGFLGLYQVNAQVPSNAPIGSAVPLAVSIGGKTSNQASIAVTQSGQ